MGPAPEERGAYALIRFDIVHLHTGSCISHYPAGISWQPFLRPGALSEMCIVRSLSLLILLVALLHQYGTGLLPARLCQRCSFSENPLMRPPSPASGMRQVRSLSQQPAVFLASLSVRGPGLRTRCLPLRPWLLYYLSAFTLCQARC